MQYDIKSIIFFAIALLIAGASIYALDEVHQQYPFHYLDRTYLYRKQFRGALVGLFVALLMSLFTYLISKSFELAVSLAAFFICFVLVYLVWGLYWQHVARRRGARREDHK
jgi:cell division protein FtsW (lipid II flippase)